jgi:hypothetical protein
MTTFRAESAVQPSSLMLDESDETPAPSNYECDGCGRVFEGAPGGAGLLIWTRGSEVRYEEPPLCEACAAEITIGALLKWDVEEEEEG